MRTPGGVWEPGGEQVAKPERVTASPPQLSLAASGSPTDICTPPPPPGPAAPTPTSTSSSLGRPQPRRPSRQTPRSPPGNLSCGSALPPLLHHIPTPRLSELGRGTPRSSWLPGSPDRVAALWGSVALCWADSRTAHLVVAAASLPCPLGCLVSDLSGLLGLLSFSFP